MTFEVAHGSSGQRRWTDRGWIGGPKVIRVRKVRRSVSRISRRFSRQRRDRNRDDELKGSSGTRSIRLATDDRLHSYPFAIRSFSNKDYRIVDFAPKVVDVGGLVDPQQMWIEALTISHEWMLLLFVTLVVAMIWPAFVRSCSC